MATGYVVSGRGDLDDLFRARLTAAGSNVNFLSNGGVDLAQRFEPRDDTVAIANVNFRSGATDLAQIFMGIGVATDPVLVTRTLVAGDTGSPAFNIGWANTAVGYTGYTGSSMSAPSPPSWTKGGNTFTLQEIRRTGATPDYSLWRVTNPSATPANADSTWQFMRLTGVFANSGGATVARTMYRSTIGVSVTGTTPTGAIPMRNWQIGGAIWTLINGNSYTLEIA